MWRWHRPIYESSQKDPPISDQLASFKGHKSESASRATSWTFTISSMAKQQQEKLGMQP